MADEKILARRAVRLAILAGRLKPPNELPCADCEHAWKPGERRHEYDHHLGYAKRNWLAVQAVCSGCHSRRDNAFARRTHCKNGHPFTPENIGPCKTWPNARICRACSVARSLKYQAKQRERAA